MDHKWNAKEYADKAGFVSELGRPALELLSPSAGERILDVGCGDGTLALLIAESGAEVVGVDSSPDMVAAAKSPWGRESFSRIARCVQTNPNT